MANNRKAKTKTARFAIIPTIPINNLLMRPLEIHEDLPASIIPIIDKIPKIVIKR